MCEVNSESSCEQSSVKFNDAKNGLISAISYIKENSPISEYYVQILTQILEHISEVHTSRQLEQGQQPILVPHNHVSDPGRILEAISNSLNQIDEDTGFSVGESGGLSCGADDDGKGPGNESEQSKVDEHAHSRNCKTNNSAKTHKTVQQAKANRRNPNLVIDAKLENFSELVLPRFYCTICNQSCKEPIDLQKHFQTHEGQEHNYQCVVCGEKSANSSALNKHLLTHKVFSCHHCGKTCSRPSYLRQHLKIHTGERPYACTYCEKRFTHSNHLREHENMHTGKKPFPCPICDESFTWRNMLNSHMKNHDEQLPYKCEECSEAFKGLRQLKDHTRKNHRTPKKSDNYANPRKKVRGPERKENRPKHIKPCSGKIGQTRFFCSYCNKGFNKPPDLQMHFQRHDGQEQNHECVFCGDRYESAEDVYRHVLTYKPFLCEFCDKGFSMGTNLRMHLRTHTGERPYACTYCGKTFPSPCHMKEHVTIHTGEKLLSCNLCGKSFRWEKTYKYHMERHENEQSYKCSYDQCERAFSTRDGLSGHINRVHKGIRRVIPERPKIHMCSSCGKAFNYAFKLKKHESAIHAKEHPFTCSHCGRTFPYRWSWKIHVRRHTENNPQNCKICGKQFNNAISLRAHFLAHTRERKFPCALCGKKFPTSYQVNRHQAVHIKNKPFVCLICLRRFTKEERLEVHNRKIHGLISETSNLI